MTVARQLLKKIQTTATASKRSFDQRAQRGLIRPQGVVDRGRNQRHLHRRVFGSNFLEFRIHRPRHADIRGALGLEHAEGGRRPPVQPGNGADFRDAVVHVGDLAQTERAAAACDDLGIRELGRRFGAAQHPDRLLAPAHLRAAARRIEIQGPQLLVDLDRGEAQRLQARRIELDANFPADAAAAGNLRHAGDREQALGHGIVDEPTELFRRARRGGHGVVGDRIAVDALALNQRLHDAQWKVVPHFRHCVAHIGDGPIDGRADLELEEDIRPRPR